MTDDAPLGDLNPEILKQLAAAQGAAPSSPSASGAAGASPPRTTSSRKVASKKITKQQKKDVIGRRESLIKSKVDSHLKESLGLDLALGGGILGFINRQFNKSSLRAIARESFNKEYNSVVEDDFRIDFAKEDKAISDSKGNLISGSAKRYGLVGGVIVGVIAGLVASVGTAFLAAFIGAVVFAVSGAITGYITKNRFDKAVSGIKEFARDQAHEIKQEVRSDELEKKVESLEERLAKTEEKAYSYVSKEEISVIKRRLATTEEKDALKSGKVDDLERKCAGLERSIQEVTKLIPNNQVQEAGVSSSKVLPSVDASPTHS